MTPAPLHTEAQVRRAFYDEHPELRPKDWMTARQRAETERAAVIAFAAFLVDLRAKGEIVPALIGRVTL